MSDYLIDLWGWSEALATFILWLMSLPIELGNWIALKTGAPAPGPLTGIIDLVRSDGITSLVAVIIAINIVLLWATAFHLLIIMWIERKMYSRLQDRRGIMLGLGSSEFLRNTIGRIPLIGRWFRKPSHLGTGFLQTVADGVKLFQKEVITPANADKWMFHAAPVMISASTLMLFVAIPWSDGFWLMGSVVNGQPVNPWGILVILAAFSVAPLGILIAGWASNNKYTLIGGMRAAAQLMSYEIPMVLSIIALVIYTGTLDPFVLVRLQAAPLTWNLGPYAPVTVPWIPDWNIFNPVLWIAFIVFFITVIAEAERIPFDIPEAEAELVEGWTTEYSGMRFGIVFGFKWLRAIAGAALIAILFFGGWTGPVFASVAAPNITTPGPDVYPIPILPQEFWFTLKIYVIFVVFVWIGWSVPRVRIDQILNIGWKQLVPLSIFSILLAALARGMGWF